MNAAVRPRRSTCRWLGSEERRRRDLGGNIMAGFHALGDGEGYSLEDLVVYQYSGHKREPCARVDVLRDRLAGAGVG